MKVLTAAQMREVDRLTTERYGIPSLLLMENAAERTVEAVEKRYGSSAGKRAAVICGKGNNGGDGAAIARQWWQRGGYADVYLLGRIAETRGDARTNFDILRLLAEAPSSDLQVIEIDSVERLQQAFASTAYDLFFDAIFGTGLSRPTSGLFEAAIHSLNEAASRHPVIAVDLPSGLASDGQGLIGTTVCAHLTVTFTAPKPANLLPPACEYNGEVNVGHIGSPAELIAASGSRLSLVEAPQIAHWLTASRRSAQANKGDAGKALIIAGSRGKTGAASLAGEAAMRAGAGLVTIATPATVLPILATQTLAECMTEPLADTSDGCIAHEALDTALRLAGERDVVAIGPGIGLSEEATRKFVGDFIRQRLQPVVMDAGALSAVSPWDGAIRGSEALPLILTPHPGEMARLVGKTVANVLEDRVQVAREFALANGVILVLKGSRTLIAAPDGEVYINPTGNAGMATGGTGDVLTGVIVSLLAQRPDDPLAATLAGVYLHGLAGDRAASQAGTRAMVASDIIRHLGDAFLAIGGSPERFNS